MKYINKYTVLILLLIDLSIPVSAQTVRMETVLGDIDIELRSDVAPNTVANFLSYVNDGDYNNSFIHRSVNNFIIQGGGYKFIEGQSFSIPTDNTVVNEFSLSNLRGTIAMAKPDNDQNGARSQWFFNTVDNSFLDSQNGGFTVFGTVSAGMDVVDAINALNNDNVGISLNGTVSTFSNVPYLNARPSVLEESDAVILSEVYLLETPLTINQGLNGNWFNQETSGQGIFLDILGGLDLGFMGWFTYDTQAPADDAVENIGSAGHRWLTGLGDVDYDNNSITFDLTSTSGGLFDNGQVVTSTEANSYGTLTMTFTDCNNATVDYNLIAQELSGTFSVTRVAGNVELCERLSREAAR